MPALSAPQIMLLGQRQPEACVSSPTLQLVALLYTVAMHRTPELLVPPAVTDACQQKLVALEAGLLIGPGSREATSTWWGNK